MNLLDALKLGHDLLQPHINSGELPSSWRIEFDNARVRFGVCRHRTNIIGLSKHLVKLNDETEVRDTILHELAHALTPGAGHGWKWKLKAKEIGARPSRCYDSKNVVGHKPTWRGSCPNCGRTVERYARRAQLACGACCRAYNGGKHSELYKFKWERNI